MADKEMKLFDKRVVDRYVAKGLVTSAEYDNYMKTLPDLEKDAQWVEMDLHDTELGDDLGPNDH